MDLLDDLINRFFIQDVEAALRMIRVAWVVGFLWSGWSFVGIMSGIWSLSVDGDGGLGLIFFILIVCEVGFMGGLSYGVLRRRRMFGMWLFLYFWFSRFFWILVGLIGFGSYMELGRFIVLQVLPCYVFFQGMRGTLSYYYLRVSDD